MFPLLYHSVFISRFRESSVLHHFVLADFANENYNTHKKFLSLWILQDYGVSKRKKKENQFKKTNRKKMINITKTVCNHDATTGESEH